VTASAEALLAAMRKRAIARNAVRDEQRRNTREGSRPPNDKLASWKAYQLAEAQLVATMTAWEIEEGVGDQ
jgi:hypothetical protein